jgi:hypothetical protein
MRSFTIAIICTCVFLALVGSSHAVGLYVVGKEECNCSPLVARGIVPDTLNQLTEALWFPQVAVALDRIAVELKAMLASVGPQPEEVNGEKLKAPEETPETKSEIEKKPQEKPAVQKPAKHKQSKAPAKKIKKKKKVKIPPRTAQKLKA